MMQVVEILLQVRQELTYQVFYIVNIMGADVLATQGARASATMKLAVLTWNNFVPARWGLIISNRCHFFKAHDDINLKLSQLFAQMHKIFQSVYKLGIAIISHKYDSDGLVQGCGNSIANTLE